MFNKVLRTGLVLSAIALIVTSCSDEASVSGQPANASDLDSGDPSATPGILGGEQTDSTSGSTISLEAPVVQVNQGGAIVSDESGKVSGEIMTAGQIDTYTFDVSDDQTIYLVETGGCSISGGDSLAYEFKGAVETRGDLADVGDRIDCGKVSYERTDSSGPVQLTITSENSAYGDAQSVGTYSFQITIVSDPTPVPLTLGEVAAPDSPQVGAGKIEHLGQTDLYTFPVTEGAVYKIVGQGGCKVENGDNFSFELGGVSTDWIDGSTYFDEQSVDSDCNETYLFMAEESGTARMEVAGENPTTTGTYSFLVDEANSTEFTLPEADASAATGGTSETTTPPETAPEDAMSDS